MSILQDLARIIQQDFFPDLTKLQAQNEYLEAVERKDTEEVRRLLVKYGPKRVRPHTNLSAGEPFGLQNLLFQKSHLFLQIRLLNNQNVQKS